jgi:hypothetical protein
MNPTNDSTETHRLARAFFGRESCVRFEHNSLGTWMMLGRKNGTGWVWQKAKLSPAEVGDILCVVHGKTDKVGFFHTFEKDGVKKETRITVSKAQDGPNVFFRIEEHAKPLNPGEQEVLAVFLQRVLHDGCVDGWRPDVQGVAAA